MSFQEDLAYSQDPELAELLDAYYVEFFGAYGNVIEVEHVTNLKEQRHGYDKVVKLDTDQFFRVEVKADWAITGRSERCCLITFAA